MKKGFAPGCALSIYKPELASKVYSFLIDHYEIIDEHTTCCMHEPKIKSDTQIINICPGCDRRYRQQ